MDAVTLVVASLAWAASEAPEPYVFEDALDDATSGGEPATGSGADSIDVVSAGMREDGDDLVFHLEIKDLEGLQDEQAKPGFHAQYALTFESQGVYSMRADYAGFDHRPMPPWPLLPPLPLEEAASPWRFQIHDHATDEWPRADGWIENNTIYWRVSPSDVGIEDTVSHWGVTTWNSYDDRDQIGDHADAHGIYQLGIGLVQPRPIAELEGGLLLVDAEDDVTSRGDPYEGADARPVDILALAGGEGPDGMVFTLVLDDLSSISDFDAEPGFSVQYAASFETPERGVYSLRATYRGDDMSHGSPGWSFSLHDQVTDEWPEIPGQAQSDRLVWVLDPQMVGVFEGNELTGWSVSAWLAYDDRSQRNDWAGGHGVYTVGEGPAVESVHVESSHEHHEGVEAFEDVPGPGSIAVMAAIVCLAAIRRR